MWPFTQTQKRSSEQAGPGTIIHRPSLDDELLPSPLRVADVAYVEAGVRLFCDAVAGCAVNGGPPAVNSSFLHFVTRHLLLRGESLHLIDTSSGEIRLHPASSWTVSGTDPEPSSWAYRSITVSGPDQDRTRSSSADGVVHIRINTSPERPDRGRSPLLLSRKTAELATLLETRLVEESRASTGQLISLTLPLGADDGGQYEQAYRKLSSGLGGSTFVERQSMPDGAARQNFAGKTRMGPEYHNNQIELRRELRSDLANALGIPAELLGENSALPVREAFRYFVLARVAPMLRIIAEELQAKLSMPMLKLDHAPLVGRDLTNTARAIKSLTDAGMSLDQATAICGIMADGD